MNQSASAGNSQQRNITTGCRAIRAALVGLMVFWGGTSMAQTKGNGDLPEFQLPSFGVDVFGADITLPKPVNVTAPRVHNGLKGTEVTMTFIIAKSGRVTLVVDDASPYIQEEFELACLMHRKLRAWKFDPALDKYGNPIAVKVILPVKVIEKGEVPKAQLASVSFNQPVIVQIAEK